MTWIGCVLLRVYGIENGKLYRFQTGAQADDAVRRFWPDVGPNPFLFRDDYVLTIDRKRTVVARRLSLPCAKRVVDGKETWPKKPRRVFAVIKITPENRHRMFKPRRSRK